MKFIFHTLGCKLNFAESSSLGKELINRGHERVGRSEEADVCVVNTCSVTEAADHKGRQAIHRLRRQHPHAVMIVTGCYAQLKPEEVSAMLEVDYVLGMNEKFTIPDLVDKIARRREVELNSIDPDVQNTGGTSQCDASTMVSKIRQVDEFHPSCSKDDRTRCFLKVQDGCDYFCTYCTIPYARGKSRNTTIAATINEVRKTLEESSKEIVLTGVNIGDFGKSTGERFVDLLRAIDAVDGEFRVRISSCEPNLLTDEIIDFVAQSTHFAPHFHIPLQSGSNEVLKIMGRRYTRELFADRVAHIKQAMPNAFIGVDCMVGVRGETDAYFDDYLQFIQSLPVSQLHVFTYSERQGTRMLSLDLPSVPLKERKRRSDIMHDVSERKLAEFYATHKGKEAVVLWESKCADGMMYGFTENYIKVSCPYSRNLVNSFQRIII